MFNLAEDASESSHRSDLASLTHGRGSLEGRKREEVQESEGPSKVQKILLGIGVLVGVIVFLFVNWLSVKIMKIILPGYLAKLILFLAYYYSLRYAIRQAAFPGFGKMSQRQTEFQYGQ